MELDKAVDRLILEKQLLELQTLKTQANLDLCEAIDVVLNELRNKGDTNNGCVVEVNIDNC